MVKVVGDICGLHDVCVMCLSPTANMHELPGSISDLPPLRHWTPLLFWLGSKIALC